MTDSQRWFWVFGILFVGALVYLLAPVLTPFVIAVLLAYFLNPLVDRLVTWHIPRILSVILVFVILILVITLLILIVVPVIEHQIVDLLKRLIPQVNGWLTKEIWPWLNQYFSFKENINLNAIETNLLKALHSQGGLIGKVWGGITHSSMALISFVSTLILVPVVCFYLLVDWEKITNAASSLLPRREERGIVSLIRECGEVLSAFLRGQLMVMICLGVLYSVGLWFVGLNVGVLIGMLAGLFSIVPYLGFFTGIVMAIVATMMQFGDWTHLIWVLVVFGIGEVAESFVLVPWLVGDRVGIHPVAVIFAVMVGGKLFGFVGVLLAVPVSAVIMVFLRHLRRRYVKSQYYND